MKRKAECRHVRTQAQPTGRPRRAARLYACLLLRRAGDLAVAATHLPFVSRRRAAGSRCSRTWRKPIRSGVISARGEALVIFMQPHAMFAAATAAGRTCPPGTTSPCTPTAAALIGARSEIELQRLSQRTTGYLTQMAELPESYLDDSPPSFPFPGGDPHRCAPQTVAGQESGRTRGASRGSSSGGDSVPPTARLMRKYNG